MTPLINQVAVITGAGRGIGRAITVALAREGAKVALNYQSSDAKAQEVVDEITKLGGTCVLAKANLADPKEARADRLAQQRGDAAKKYVTDKGIAATRIDVRKAGGQAGAAKQNRRIDVVWVPEGASY